MDEYVLLMLAKRQSGVKASIFTAKIGPQLALDVRKHNEQYPEIVINIYKKLHDRFLIIDNSDVYHIGASLKDLGKKLFAFSRMDIRPETLLQIIGKQ